MRRIANGTQAAAPPVVNAPVGTPGYASNGNPAAGQQGGIFGAVEYHILSEEVVNAIQGAGLALDSSGVDLAQLLQAIIKISGRPILEVTSSMNFTVPPGVYGIRARAWSGTGGAGGSANPSSAGSGSSGGAYVEAWIPVTPGQVLELIVGAGGLGGAPGQNGQPGGHTAITGYFIAYPGAVGLGANGIIASGPGPGGTYIIGPGINAFGRNGQPGTSGYPTGDNGIIAGNGGPAWHSPAPTGPATDRNTPQLGTAGQFPGAGGTGGASGGSGGSGAAGLIILEL